VSTFAEHLKEQRIKHHKTLQSASIDTGLPLSTISDYENDRHDASLFNATVLADYFNVSLDYLVGRTDKR